MPSHTQRDFQVVHVDPASLAKKRKRTTTACVRCHERKVKCDANNGTPCKVGGHPSGTGLRAECSELGDECRIHTDGRTRTSVPEQDIALQNADTLNSRLNEVYAPADFVSTISQTDSGMAEETMPAAPGQQIPSSHSPPGNSSVRQYVESSIQPELFNHAAPSMPLSITAESSSASSVEGQQEPLAVDRFESYIQDTLGSYAPSFQGSNNHPNIESHDAYIHSWSTQGSLSNVTASRGLGIEMSSRSTLELERQVVSLNSEDMDYLKAKGAFDLPPRSLQAEIIDAHFAEVHPTVPIINKTEFMSEFENHRIPGRLLLFAVLMSGSRVCRNPALLDHKGTNHSSALRFYRATKALLDTGYERNKLARVQAQLLITWWWDKKDDGGRNMRSCTADAISTAQSMGMHRWDQYPHSDTVLLGVWKRTWWTCFSRDIGVSVAHGLPSILSLSSSDVHALTPDDFNEEPDVAFQLRKYASSETEVAFSIYYVKVMEALHHIHRDFFIAQRLQPYTTGGVESREAAVAANPTPPGIKIPRTDKTHDYHDIGLQLCREWVDKIPETLKYDVSDVQGHRFWPCFLHILYLTNIMIRFRDKAVSRPTTERAAAERQYCQTRGIAAATMISKIMRNVRAHGQVLKFTGLLTNSLFNCLIFFFIEGQSYNPDVRRDAQAKYSLCLNMLYEFSQLWVSASLIHRLFEALQANMQLANSQASPAPFLYQLHQSPLPGLQLSSDITNSYMRQLIATDFYSETSSVDTGSLDFGQYTNDFGRLTPPTQYSPNESSPRFDQAQSLTGSLPESLDIEQWVGFFGLNASTSLNKDRSDNYPWS